MASKTVSDVFLRLKLQGQEQVAGLKSAFRGLTSTLDVTDKAIEDLRKGLLDYTNQSNNSIKVIKGQVSGLKELREQAAVGGKVFKQLSKDIEGFERQLRKAEVQAASSGRALSFRAAQTKFIPRTPGAILGRISQVEAAAAETPRFGEKGELNPEFLRQQRELNVLLEARTRIEARLQASIQAGTRAKVDNNNENLTAAQITERYSKGIEFNAKTTTELSIRLRELRSELKNITLGSREYSRALAEINVLEQQIADPFGTAARKEQIRGRLGTQQQFGMFAGTDPVAKSIRRNRQKQARSAPPRAVPRQVTEVSGLYRQISDIGMAGIQGRIEAMGGTYKRVATDIRAATAASNGSINSLQSQRAAWSTLQGSLNPASAAYREVGKEIDRVDKRLSRLTSKQRIASRIRGNLGAAAAGAVFGGPEAAIGGLAGGIGGAALGAQVGLMRQALSANADYVSELRQLDRALKGVFLNNMKDANKALAAHEQAVRAAEDVTEALNVPQEVAVRGMTRLSAAVLGAGGSVNDAELAFKNITAAIKANAGSADDVNSALTAMVQIFSKGKVSAEELSGQLGERFPGAVTLFAKANDMSMQELQKALKNGEVGLNQLMRFVVEVGAKFSDTALEMAEAPEAAGDRAKIAMNKLRIAIGEEIQPIGAELQAVFADTLVDLIPVITMFATKAADALKVTMDMVAKLIKRMRDLKDIVIIVAGGAGLGVLIKGLSSTAITGALLVTQLGKVIKALKTIRVLSLLNPFTAAATGALAGVVAYERYANSAKYFAESVEIGTTTVEDGKKKLADYRAELNKLRDSLPGLSTERITSRGGGGIVGDLPDTPSELDRAQARMNELTGQILALDKAIKSAEGRGKASALDLKTKQLLDKLTKFADPTAEGDGEGKTLMTEKELKLRKQLLDAVASENKEAQIKARYNLDSYLATLETEDANKSSLMTYKAIVDRDKASLDLAKERKKLAQDFNFDLKERQFQLGLITKEEHVQNALARERARLEEQFKGVPGAEGMVEAGVDLKRQEIDPTQFEQASQKIAQLKKEMEELLNPVNQIVGAANAIGESFSSSFISVINGSQTAQQALAGFFQNVANYFLDMAAQIITKMITMAILNSIVSVLPGGGATSGSSGGMNMPTGIGDTYKSFLTNANGNVFNGGLKRYAMGGIVDKPTLFKYANGGTGRFGLMGEAGPEAIMPLKRGADGKLGVAGGGGVNVGEINIKVENTGEQLSPTAQKQIANQVQGIVMANLVNERRSGGVLR